MGYLDYKVRSKLTDPCSFMVLAPVGTGGQARLCPFPLIESEAGRSSRFDLQWSFLFRCNLWYDLCSSQPPRSRVCI